MEKMSVGLKQEVGARQGATRLEKQDVLMLGLYYKMRGAVHVHSSSSSSSSKVDTIRSLQTEDATGRSPAAKPRSRPMCQSDTEPATQAEMRPAMPLASAGRARVRAQLGRLRSLRPCRAPGLSRPRARSPPGAPRTLVRARKAFTASRVWRRVH